MLLTGALPLGKSFVLHSCTLMGNLGTFRLMKASLDLTHKKPLLRLRVQRSCSLVLNPWTKHDYKLKEFLGAIGHQKQPRSYQQLVAASANEHSCHLHQVERGLVACARRPYPSPLVLDILINSHRIRGHRSLLLSLGGCLLLTLLKDRTRLLHLGSEVLLVRQ